MRDVPGPRFDEHQYIQRIMIPKEMEELVRAWVLPKGQGKGQSDAQLYMVHYSHSECDALGMALNSTYLFTPSSLVRSARYLHVTHAM